MTKEQKETKLKEIQDKFDATTKQVNELNAELLRLQGEYRVIQNLEIEKGAEDGGTESK